LSKTTNMVRIAIISDVHCHTERDIKSSYYIASMPDTPFEKNPFSSLTNLIKKNGLQFDYILSPGDFADKIDEKGLKVAWDQLKLLYYESKSKYLIGTIGNHDVSSKDSGDSFRSIKSVLSDFPIYRYEDIDSVIKNQLLINAYFTFESEDIFFLILNSSFDHWSSNEARHGKFNESSYSSIESKIKETDKKIKICMMHHHPIIHETGNGDTNDIVENNDKLWELLVDFDFVIHGHKHDFRLTQKKIYPKNLSIIASGSFSCYKEGLAPGGLNMFHVIELLDDEVENCKNQGFLQTYTYSPYDGWKHVIRLTQGFGCTLNDSEIITKLESEITSQENPYLEYIEICELIPWIKFNSQSKIRDIFRVLENNRTIKRITYSNDGIIDTIIIK
jgi:predicted phosphodiesterase